MDKEELRKIVAQAVGQASMCWEPIPAGVFDSSKAVELVDAAVKLVEGLAERTQQEAQPFGYVTKIRTGVQHFYPDSPYVDNAVECVPVYTRPTSAASSTAPMQPSEQAEGERDSLEDRLNFSITDLGSIRRIYGEVGSRDVDVTRANRAISLARRAMYDAIEALAAPTQAAGGEAASDAASWAKEWGMMVQSVDALTGAQRTAYQFTSERFGHMMDAFERHVRAAVPAAAVPLSSMPDLQAAVAKGLADGSLVPQGAAVAPEGLTAATEYARNLAVALHRDCYPEVTQWKPLDDLLGLLTQIDNMVSGMARIKSATPDEPVKELRAHLAAIAVVGQIDGHDVIRRLSVLDMADRGIGDQP